jgi:hypothetical protein
MWQRVRYFYDKKERIHVIPFSVKRWYAVFTFSGPVDKPILTVDSILSHNTVKVINVQIAQFVWVNKTANRRELSN